MLYTLPAQVFVVASVVYNTRSSFRGSKCCIHYPLVFSCSQVLHTLHSRTARRISMCAHVLTIASAVCTLPARVQRFVIAHPFCLKITSLLDFVVLGPVCFGRSITHPLKSRHLKSVNQAHSLECREWSIVALFVCSQSHVQFFVPHVGVSNIRR